MMRVVEGQDHIPASLPLFDPADGGRVRGLSRRWVAHAGKT